MQANLVSVENTDTQHTRAPEHIHELDEESGMKPKVNLFTAKGEFD